jgi:phosphatidylserine/phosphatidylglycerophosphate/cardiolipin synthase-like enzyme
MKNKQMNIGDATRLESFLARVEAAPKDIREVLIVSPFVNLGGTRDSLSPRLCRMLAAVEQAGGKATLISDDTPARRADFLEACKRKSLPDGILFLHEKLHAKCGYAATKSGRRFAFVGSANLTDAGLHRNTELVLTIETGSVASSEWRLLAGLRNAIDTIRRQSSPTCALSYS